MALQNVGRIQHQANQQLRIRSCLESAEYAYGVLTTG